MSAPTGISTNSKAQDSRVFLTNQGGAFKRVTSATITTVVLENSAGITTAALYTATAPGMLVILASAAGASNHGKTANITAYNDTTHTATVDVDFSTGSILANDDTVAIIPPLAVELFLNGPHTLNVTLNDDETMGLTETFLTHSTRLGSDVGGDVPFFMARDSEGLGRLILAGVGGYKVTGTTHKYRPFKADDGTFTSASDFTLYSKDGNNIINQVFLGEFGTQLVLDFPERAISTGSLSTLGSGHVREVGGTGKTFPSGTNKWIPATITCDTGPRHTFQGVFVEFGGAFGAGLTDAADRFVKSARVTISRGAVSDAVLGNQFIIKPIEDMHGISVTFSRILEDDSVYEKSYGAATDAEPGQPQLTRLLLKAIHVGDTTKTITIDIPNGKFRSNVTRQRGRFVEDVTFTGIQKVDVNGCVDSANPLYQIDLATSFSTNLATAL